MMSSTHEIEQDRFERDNLIDHLRARNAELEAKLAALVEAAEVFMGEAIVLSADYLEAFNSYKDDDCIQGWDKARWIRALDAEDKLKAAVAAAKVTP